MGTDRIGKVFASTDTAFIPYITAGHPTTDDTIAIMRILVDAGADIIELGFPFSDPTADGPTIQASSFAALENGFKTSDYFTILQKFRSFNTNTPLVIFSYFNPIFHFGVERFATRVSELGADAVLIVDLPVEEQAGVKSVFAAEGLHLIQIIAPTTPPERARRILSGASGFVYQVSLRGVTGERVSLADDLETQTKTIKSMTDLPVAVGFGISTASHIRSIYQQVDGIVIGSAIVSLIGNSAPDYHDPLRRQVREFSDAIHGVE